MTTTFTRHASPAARRFLTLLTALLAAACGDAFQVTNPNQLGETDLDRPEAAAALVNGAEATLARAIGHAVLPLEAASDDLRAIGSYDAARELDQGFISSTSNEFSTNAFVFLAESRFLAAEAIRRLEQFDAAGTLKNRAHLARAYLYGAVASTYIADAFENFVISDRRTASPPLGAANVVHLYDSAVVYLDRALPIARSVGNGELERTVLAQRARTRHARAVWGILRRGGAAEQAGDGGFVSDSGAAADAAAALALLPSPAWRFQLRFAAATVGNATASWINTRQEFRPEDALVVPTTDNKRAASVRLPDPIEGRPDAALAAAIAEFAAGGQYAPVTILSARELRLIVAEVALARGDSARAATEINAVRALDRLTPYAGQIQLADLLRHARRVNLFLQGRRLADQYRFGIRDPRWLSTSDAVARPGTLLPIPEIERLSNCHISGSC